MMHRQSILLVCGNGLSTSILVSSLQDLIIQEHLSYDVRCCDIESSVIEIYACDMILIAPQVMYYKETLEPIAKMLHIPLEVIDALMYRCFDGRQILTMVIERFASHQVEVSFHIELLHWVHGGALAEMLLLDMKKKIAMRDEHITVTSSDISIFDAKRCQANVVLLEPQLAFRAKEIEPYLNAYATAFGVLDRHMVARFDGGAILEYALGLYETLYNKRKEEYIKNEMEDFL